MRQTLGAIAILLLTACGGSQDPAGNAGGNAETNAGGGETAVPPAAVAAIAFSPGEWESRVQVTRLEITGVPQVPGRAARPMPPTTTVRTCLTPEQAARPTADFLSGSGRRTGCTYEDFSMAGGRIQGTINCTSGRTTIRTTMSGSYGADSYEVESQSRISSGRVTMETAGRTSSRRIGDCPAAR